MLRLLLFALGTLSQAADLTLGREDRWLIVRGPHLPGGEIRINYLEAYCRPGSTDADWIKHTVIRHSNQVLESTPKRVVLKDTLADGVEVSHTISARGDSIEFSLDAMNPGKTASEAHWAQPCVRLGAFTGHSLDLKEGNLNDYISKCFIFLDGKLSRMPTPDWAMRARYMPGQVWRPAHVPADDVNPRPVNPRTPSNGLIGCFSGDEKWIFATAWEPYQELFQGVARCVHSDFRLGGLKPGERKRVKGRIYVVPNDAGVLLKRYATDFPEHRKK